LEVRSNDAGVRAKREATARRVLEEFSTALPDLKLLAFLDDQDCFSFKQVIGQANRGLFSRAKPGNLAPDPVYWPDYVLQNLETYDPPDSLWAQFEFDGVIYLHGSTCFTEAGLVMTFSHELQHFVQYGFHRALWAVNSLLTHLSKQTIKTTGLKVFQIPIERQARIVSKRVAEQLCGVSVVGQYIDRRIDEKITPEDLEDWQFVQKLSHSVTSDLEEETKSLFRQLGAWKTEVEE